MKITKRRAVSVEEVTAKLDALALLYRIERKVYDESAAESMSEFDALKWTSLCSQRCALLQRESALQNREIPSKFLGIYKTPLTSSPLPLENTYDGLSKLAA